jgi:hypothetical protein
MVIAISEIVGHSVLDFIDYALLFIVIMIIYYLFKLLFHGDHKHLPNQNPWDWLKPHLPKKPVTPPPHNPPIIPPTPGPGPNPPTPGPIVPPPPTPRPPPGPRPPTIKKFQLYLDTISSNIKKIIKLYQQNKPGEAERLFNSTKISMTKAGGGRKNNKTISEHIAEGTHFTIDAQIINNRIKELRKLMNDKNLDFKDKTVLESMNSLIGAIIKLFGELVTHVSIYKRNNP